MFTSVSQFTDLWQQETQATAKLLNLLTDQSLSLPKDENIRSVGRAAWHIVCAYTEICNRFGIPYKGPTEKKPIPTSAAEIKTNYNNGAAFVRDTVRKWSDADLQQEDDMYGETWKRGKSLYVLLAHEMHHRGQLTVIMRLAGLPMTGIYGPAKEEWAKYGMKAPEV